MIVVTGGAGFIGSNLLRELNQRGREDLLVVDELTSGSKFKNIVDCKIIDYIDKDKFRELINENDDSIKEIEVIFHQGACTDTTEQDGRYMMDNNYTYSKEVLHYCLRNKAAMIYASSAAVYGMSTEFREEEQFEKPINVYAYSKLLFDNYVRRTLTASDSQIVGLRYFNVYGRGEKHKDAMSSMVFQLNSQLLDTQKLKLFADYDGCEAGDQKRDFVSVEDAVAVNLWFWENASRSGIFNVGTGVANTFNEMANIVIDWHENGHIEYIPFPDSLKGSYQSYTQANLDKLHETGCHHTFMSLREGVQKYLAWLNA